MGKVRLEISTNVYDKPLICDGIKDESYDFISYEWVDTRDGDKPSKYVLKYSKTTHQIILNRSGEVRSTLIFESGKETKGTFDTPYGEMVFRIQTDYINLPNMFSPKLEFAYRMLENEDLDKNIFAIKEVG